MTTTTLIAADHSSECKARFGRHAGILQEAMGRGEYWRLVDSQGRPPGLLGMWPSRAVTFIENHDTGMAAHVPLPHQSHGHQMRRHHCRSAIACPGSA